MNTGQNAFSVYEEGQRIYHATLKELILRLMNTVAFLQIVFGWSKEFKLGNSSNPRGMFDKRKGRDNT